MTIFSLTSSLTWFLIRTMHVWVLHRLRGRCLAFVLLIIPPFHLAFNVFPFVLCTKLSLPHLLAFGVTHYICANGQLLNVVRTHLFRCSHGGEQTTSHNVVRDAFAFHCEKHRVSCFIWTNPFPSTTFLSIFFSTSWHHAINWWHLHLGWFGHC
jgi:hypothetical protein